MSDTTKVKNWSFPFKPKAGKLDPIQHLTAMAQASGGYYPVGANGQWHGGVHFDGETEAVFDQSQVCCIADGEVIAYRIDTRHPESQYFNSAGASFNAVFSRSFVLVKHHLEAPAKPTAAGTAPEPPPSLTFFSLYMHLLNWEGYTGTNAPNPPAFLGEALYKVKADKATDPVRGLRIRAEPRTGRVVALIPKGSKVRVGDAHPIHSGWYRLLAVVEGRTLPAVAITENMWVFPGEMEQTAEAGIFLVGERANDQEPTLAPERGLNVRKNGNGRRDDPIVGVLPLGATFRLESSTGTYCKLKEIVDGKDIAPLSPDSAGNIQGFVHIGSLESTRSAPKLDKVYVLPTPHPIKAGELIGHLGHYQNENDRSPQRLLHLEVFSCEEVPAFIAKSQAWAAGLPDEQKTLLKVHKNASKLIPHRDDINASNPPKISDAGTTVGVDLIIPQSLLDGLPADSKLQENTTLPSSATPTTTRWWRLDNLLADNNGNPISGWLAEQDLITTRHSPWEWEGYDFIQETGSPVGKATYFYEAWRRLTNEESANYRALVSQEDQGPIKARLYDIIRPGGAKGLLTAQEIGPALAKPWHAQSIAQLVTHYESEWYWKPDKWDELDPLMGHLPGIDPNLNWASEKARINELCWWGEMAGKHGISADGKAWHFQPILATSMFAVEKSCISVNKAQEISLLVSTGYEGATTLDYEALADNFDGQGMSFGLIQWNFGQGTLGPVLQAMRVSDGATFDNCFGTVLNLSGLKEALDAGDHIQQKNWAISAQSSHREEWKKSFKALGKVEKFKEIQLKFAANYHNNVMSCINLMREISPQLMEKIELVTYVALYDLCVQQNNLNRAKDEIQSNLHNQELSTQRDILRYVCIKRAHTARSEYVSDCLSRRLGIIQKSTHTATAHGITKSRANANFGLIVEGIVCDL